MTKAEWALVEEKLQLMHAPVALSCDGYHVMLNLEPISHLRNAICVYVNGTMRLYPEPCEEQRRFQYPSRRSVMKAEDKRKLLKEPKWLQKRLKATSKFFDPDATYTVYKPWWGSFKALRAHLVKHNQEIDLLKSWRFLPSKGDA